MPKKELKKNKKLIPVIFTQIKNRFFGNAEIYSPRAPLPPSDKKPYFDELLYSENVWDEIGEKPPFEKVNEKLNYMQKAEILFERLEKEPNPKKFIEIFQAIYNLMYQNFETGITPRNNGYTITLLNKMFWSLVNAFKKYGYEDLILYKQVKERDWNIVDLKTALLSKKREPYKYKIPEKYKIEYIGNIFGEKESEKLILDGFKSEKLEKFILESKKKKNIFIKIRNFIKNINISLININK